MPPATYHARRATIDDLAQLRALWQAMNFPVADLEKRLTEFQVALDAEGRVVGAVGLQFAEKQGLIHYEAFADFSVAETVRPQLWERVQQAAKNNGIFRLWTCEAAPFWSHCGLVPATPEVLNRLPAQWRGKEVRWLTLQLREEIPVTRSVEQEFERFMAAERQRTQATLEQAKLIKTLATILAIILAGGVIVVGVYFLSRQPLPLAP